MSSEPLPQGPVRLIDLEDVEDGEVRLVEADGLAFAVCSDGDQWYAVDDSCPHRGMSLSTGSVEGGVLTCEWHGYRYDLASGACLDAVTEPIAAHRLAVHDGALCLEPGWDQEQ